VGVMNTGQKKMQLRSKQEHVIVHSRVEGIVLRAGPVTKAGTKENNKAKGVGTKDHGVKKKKTKKSLPSTQI
jgi:hypothetical protein